VIEIQRTMLDGRLASIRFTSRRDGNLGVRSSDVGQVRDALDRRPWTWLSQVHGAQVVQVCSPGQHAGAEGDGSITTDSGCVLSVQGADCAPVAFWSPQGVAGVAHVGWRGALEGVVARTVETMRSVGAGDVYAVLGPHIRPGSYEFAPADLQIMIDRFGESVAARTLDNKPALDMSNVLQAALDNAGALIDFDTGICTSNDHWYSHRVRSDGGRHGAIVVIEEADESA